MFEFLKSLFFTEKRALGAEPNPLDIRDIQLATFQMPTSLPREYKTDIYFLPVTDQKAHGSCVGQAEGTAIAYFDYLENKNVNISRRFIYAKCKLVDGIPDAQGTYPRVAGSILSNIGATTGLFVPDDNSLTYAQYLAIPGDTALLVKDAKSRRANYAAVALDLESIKQAIYKNKIVTITLAVDWSAWRRSKLKAPRPGYIAGFHRVTLYGFDGGELFGRNSWGEQWGNNGNFSFDYDDYEGYMMDAIAYTDIPNEILEEAKNTPFTFTRILRFGTVGADVKKLQEFLGAKPSDGWFGKITQAAVIRFQQSNGLVADGVVGPKTIEKLNKPSFMLTSLEMAIMKQESGGDLYAIGDKTLADKAYGCMQIRQPCVNDVNKALGKSMKSEECLGNLNLSIFIFREYQKIYNKNGTDEEKARTWNGGPGWRRRPSLTDHYWSAVKRKL